jgi:transposase-like protein
VTGRAAPLYCPYCGEESIRPWGELTEHARWRCEDCLRVFEVRYRGLTGQDAPHEAVRRDPD